MAVVCGGPFALLQALRVPVAFPHIQLPAEAITQPVRILGVEFFLSNTFVSILLADLLVILMAVVAGSAARRKLRQYQSNPRAVDAQGDDLMVPKGWHNTFEAIMEYLYNLIESVVGSKWAMSVFPIAVTIFILVLTANWLHFVPLVDSFGVLHCADPAKGHKGFEAVEIGNSGLYRLAFGKDNAIPRTGALSPVECPEHGSAGEEGGHAEETAGESPAPYVMVTPFLRTAATDLNLTLSLAIVAMVTVQVLGVRQSGPRYFYKFFNLPALSKGFLGWVELIVSWLEALSEMLKIVSLSLRLFGNIFAGAVLLLVIAYLIPVGVPLVFYLLEVLIGLLQAFVFAMLTIVFTGVAQAGHGDHAEAHH